MTVRYGLIGTGMMGQEHINNIALLDGAAVTALADPNEAMRQQAVALTTKLGMHAQVFNDYHELIQANLCDAFVIATPNDTHLEILLALLPTDKPILCEKPLATNFAACEKIIATVTKPAQVWVAMEYRYMLPIARLIEQCNQTSFAQPLMLSIREHRFPFLDKVDDWNRFNIRTGGTLVEKCCHFWDLMRLILDSDPVQVFASANAAVNHQDEQYDGNTPDILDNAYVVVDFASGARAMLDLCMFAEGSPWQEIVSVTSSTGSIEAYVPGPARFAKDARNSAHAKLVISERTTQQVTEEAIVLDEKLLHAGDHYGATYFLHQHFFDFVTGKTNQAQITLSDGAWAVRIGEAAEHSARDQQVIRLD